MHMQIPQCLPPTPQDVISISLLSEFKGNILHKEMYFNCFGRWKFNLIKSYNSSPILFHISYAG